MARNLDDSREFSLPEPPRQNMSQEEIDRYLETNYHATQAQITHERKERKYLESVLADTRTSTQSTKVIAERIETALLGDPQLGNVGAVESIRKSIATLTTETKTVKDDTEQDLKDLKDQVESNTEFITKIKAQLAIVLAIGGIIWSAVLLVWEFYLFA